ncbi:MAG: IS110 family transposase [Gammaproteobacteria bacterium]|nr:IS110 family transposase [Gammaproteobacteria bacterium]NIN62110.1 IS110 family transposase [Gammaproteobacteria bacterium]NIT05939.1 IS110 family transposase [Gammaproteobacteria bacterium]
MAKYSVSALQSFIAVHQTDPFWIGIDVHKRSYHIALLRADSKTFTFTSPASPDAFIEQLRWLNIRVAGVAYEAGPTGFSLARALQAENVPITVAAPSKIPRSVSAGSKTDRLDCLKLAHYAAKGLIRPIAIPTAEEETQRALLRRRHQLVDRVRQSKQRIKGFLLYLGFKETDAIRNWRSDCEEQIAALPLLPEGRLTMESHLRELRFLQQELSEVAKQLEHLNQQLGHCTVIKSLTSVPGVGTVVATSFHLELFRPERFQRGEEVTSYLGLAPTVRHSGEQTPRGYLAPCGQKRLRSLLIEAAWMWRAKDAKAGELYNKLLSKTGIPQKAITALARRLAIILWRLSIEQRAYRPV